MELDVKALRARLEWSQTELARFLGVADSTVARWETAERAPSGAQDTVLTTLAAVVAKATERELKNLRVAAKVGVTMQTLSRAALEEVLRGER